VIGKEVKVRNIQSATIELVFSKGLIDEKNAILKGVVVGVDSQGACLVSFAGAIKGFPIDYIESAKHRYGGIYDETKFIGDMYWFYKNELEFKRQYPDTSLFRKIYPEGESKLGKWETWGV
jgi:hypothetical protein